MLPDLAYAQVPDGGALPGILQSPLPMVLIILVIFYFLVMRPQQQKEKHHRTMLENLKRNDEVTTSGGMYGRVVSLNDKVVTLEIAPNVRVRVDRAQIAALVAAPKGADKDKDREREKEGGKA
jgi:preprotein translocase subunit YajC